MEELGFNSGEGLNMGGIDDAGLAHLQDVSGDNSENGLSSDEEAAQPQGDIRNVDGMSDEDFSKYISDVSSGVVIETPKPEPAGETEGVTVDEPKEEKPFKTFMTQEEYQKDLDKRFNKRFRDRKEKEEGLEQLLAVGREIYGDDVSTAEILSRFKKDLVLSGASQRNKEPSDFEEELTLKRKAKAYDEAENRRNRQRELLDRWQAESDELKLKIPDFDLEKAMRNQDFYQSMVSGKSVAQSYINAFAEKKPQGRTISQNAAKGQQLGATGKKDAYSMSDAEFKAYIERLKDI